MSVTLTIRDETASGKIVHEVPLVFPSERVTVRELIRERVYQEVQDYNRERGEVFRGLVQPTDSERVLNGQRTEFRQKTHRPIDWQPQYDKALDAFARGGFLILIDNRQAETLDDEFSVTPSCEISFLRLTMLVGG